jgi:hypothetical protein
MEALPAAALSSEDLDTLRRARRALESPSLATKLSSVLGTPVEKMIARLPAAAHDKIGSVTRFALRQCLRVALRTLGHAAGTLDDKPNNLAHKFAVAATGATGGAFGLFALPLELPVTTMLMFRSICDIARSEGENLDDVDAQLQCLAVLGLGGGQASAEGEVSPAAEFGYFAMRAALAQAVSKASSEVAAKGLTGHAASALMKLLQTVAARFSTQVTEQAAAKSLPVIGAALGAAVNTLFIDHFQQIATGHFAIRRLERRYGARAVEAAWHALDAAGP